MSKNLKNMASASSMVPSLLKKTFNTLDPYPLQCPTELSEGICNQSTPLPSCSYAPPVSPNKYLFKQSAQKHLSTESLDEQIQNLLTKKLVLQVVHGRPCDTIQFHRRQLAEQLVKYITGDIPDTFNTPYRDQLMTMLATAFKQTMKDMPLDESEWLKLLNQWIRINSSDDVIFNREIYKILAVDGFRGFRPKDLKHYLAGILLPIRIEYRMHAQGVRAMYEYFNEHLDIQSLTGTDSACVIFLTLLQFFVSNLELLDDQICFQIQQAKSWAEGFLHKHSIYYHDIKNVNEDVIKSLGNVYSEQFTDAKDWKIVGMELLQNIQVPSISSS